MQEQFGSGIVYSASLLVHLWITPLPLQGELKRLIYKEPLESSVDTHVAVGGVFGEGQGGGGNGSFH